MGNFTSGFWNLFIIVITLGGILALFIFTIRYTTTGSASQEGKTTGHLWDEDLEELNNPLPRWWVNMFYITLVFGVIYLIFYPGLGSNSMFLGWTQITQYEEEMAEAEKRYGPIFEKYRELDIREVAQIDDAVRIGERLYASYCTACHGSDARGVPGFPNLRDDDWLYGGAPEQIETSILDGRAGAMPPWAAVLGEDGVKAVTSYVLSLGGQSAPVADLALGKEKYTQVCVACHGADGKGNQQLGAPNLTDDIWLHGGTAEAIAESVANGRQGRMPAHREFLGEAKVHLLAAYVYSLSKQ